jgi:hypothetical protein
MYRMITSDLLSYVIDFRDGANCSRIERAQPGEKIQVLVYPEHEPLADSLRVNGTRSQDGALFIAKSPRQMASSSYSNGNTRSSRSYPSFSNRSQSRRNGSRSGRKRLRKGQASFAGVVGQSCFQRQKEPSRRRQNLTVENTPGETVHRKGGGSL